MLKIDADSNGSYNELADEFWILYNSNISDISEVLEDAVDNEGWGDLFFTGSDEEPPVTASQYRTILSETQDSVSKIIVGAISDNIRNARVTQLSSDSVTIQLDSMPDFDIELIVRPKFIE